MSRRAAPCPPAWPPLGSPLWQSSDGSSQLLRWTVALSILGHAALLLYLPGLRQSPLRDIIILPLLAAVTLVCGTGAWMGMRKLGRDLLRIRRRIRRRLSRRSFFLRSRSQS